MNEIVVVFENGGHLEIEVGSLTVGEHEYFIRTPNHSNTPTYRMPKRNVKYIEEYPR